MHATGPSIRDEPHASAEAEGRVASRRVPAELGPLGLPAFQFLLQLISTPTGACWDREQFYVRPSARLERGSLAALTAASVVAVRRPRRRSARAGCRVKGAGERMVAGDHVLRTVASTQMQMALWASTPRLASGLCFSRSAAKHKAHPKLDGETLVIVEPTSADSFRFDGSSFAPYLTSTALATGTTLRASELRRLARDSAGPKIQKDEVGERVTVCGAPWGQGAGKLRRIGVKDTQVARRLFMRAASRQGDQTRAAVQQQPPPSSADRCNPPATLRGATPSKAEKP
ncbi:uncharacterized protein PAN0_002c1289 [Moesziomyces antarcticus]|uniref:Uncharacterized protein n=1 Tax=Pseudozyma antarctica TaxID=84753 RepID=A0A5C3FIZ7_PSEA2|nr:uncharacterized protein PAN0_002c1289 [Moesziomyces antarcticus]GAK63087.1 hypothetical protein PAN0_002c1289 [Moesziomyces antarcticus]SPO43429.1 uncharacterized protein PSANT_01114 [Moesziomyces antarcticus]